MRDGWVFYAFWNGEAVRDVFEAIVAVTNSDAFAQLGACVVVLGLLAVLAMGAARYEGKNVIALIVGCVLFWFVAMVPKVSVVIEDIRSESVAVVDNVPLGIGVFGSVVNRVGYWLATAYESAFAPVEIAQFSRFGAVFPERVLSAVHSVGPITSEGRATLDAVLTGCIMPEVLTDRTKAAALTHATDLWATVSADGWVNPARRTAMPSGEVLACPAAIEALDRVLQDVELPALKALLGTRLAPDHADPSGVIAASLPQAQSLLMGLSATMDATLKHAVMLTAVPQAVERVAVRQDDPMALAVGLAKAQGNLAAEINYRTMSRIAEETLPKIRNALELVVIGCFPIVVLLALAGGHRLGLVVRSYLMLLLTVELWPALASIVNYLVVAYDAHPFTRIAETFGGSTLQSVALIRETGASSRAIAGWLMCAVPMISYALVRAGDMAVGQLVGGLTAPAQSAASANGAQLASGNIAQGNVTMGTTHVNTVSGNKRDLSMGAVASETVVTQSAYGSVTRDDGGMVTGLSRTAVNFGVSGTTTQSLARGAVSSHTVQTSSTWSDAARFNVVHSAESRDATQRQFAHALRDAINELRSTVATSSSSQAYNESLGVSRGVDMARTDRVSEGTSVLGAGRMAMSGDRRVGVGENGLGLTNGQRLPVSGVAGGALVPNLDSTAYSGQFALSSNITLQNAQALIDQANGKQGSESSLSQTQAFALVRQASENVAKTHADESVRSAARQFSQSLGRTTASSRDESQTMTDSMSAAATLNQTRSGAMMTTRDDSVSVMQGAVREAGSAEQVLRNMYVDSQRDVLAGDTHFERGARVSPRDACGVGTMLPVADRVVSIRDDAVRNVNEKHQAYEGKMAHTESGLDMGIPGGVSPAKTQAVEGEWSATQAEAQGRYQLGTEGLAFERGLLLVAREAYRQDNAEKNHALRNAFLFGIGYRNGDDFQERLRDKANDDESLRQMLVSIGSRQKVEMTNDDWKRLVTQAKY